MSQRPVVSERYPGERRDLRDGLAELCGLVVEAGGRTSDLYRSLEAALMSEDLARLRCGAGGVGDARDHAGVCVEMTAQETRPYGVDLSVRSYEAFEVDRETTDVTIERVAPPCDPAATGDFI
jgi:hypothetical protein